MTKVVDGMVFKHKNGNTVRITSITEDGYIEYTHSKLGNNVLPLQDFFLLITCNWRVIYDRPTDTK